MQFSKIIFYEKSKIVFSYVDICKVYSKTLYITISHFYKKK